MVGIDILDIFLYIIDVDIFNISASPSIPQSPAGEQRDPAQEYDRKLREAIGNPGPSPLVMGTYLARIQEGALYKNLGYKNMNDYLITISQAAGKKKPSIHRWLTIGISYLKHQDDLENAGFTEKHGNTKLLYLDEALDKHDKKEVFNKLVSLSFKDFLLYVRPMQPTSVLPKIEENLKPMKGSKAGEKNERIYIKGNLALTINLNQESDTLYYLMRINNLAKKAIERGRKVYYVEVKDTQEFLRYEDAIKKLLSKLRKEDSEKSNVETRLTKKSPTL
ncbi:MAG: hypothetical protein FWH12_01290 [Treponema sp.]|nr:hypothetical protein [Treponema sp.]